LAADPREGSLYGEDRMKILTSTALGILFLGGCVTERAFGAYDWSTHTWMTPHGIMVEDRVSGKLIDPKTAIQREYRGEIYYFENLFDVQVFERDPGVYFYGGYEPQYGGGP
jgi:YHS domain-containing protein